MITQIHATLDDVGNSSDGISAAVGYAAYRKSWDKFNWRWMMTLQQLGLSHLHTAHYLNSCYLADRKLRGDDVALILAPFIAAVRESLLEEKAVPICVITDHDAYAGLSKFEKKYIRPPDEHSFEIAVMPAARAFRSALHISDSVSIQMDEVCCTSILIG